MSYHQLLMLRVLMILLAVGVFGIIVGLGAFVSKLNRKSKNLTRVAAATNQRSLQAPECVVLRDA